MALALARKYRPSTFANLIGQEAIAKTLSLALDNGKLSHAYLFSGIRGSGKTSTARIFAKSLLCENGPTSHPCQECQQCQMANEGRHIDIIEMDAASNRGIEDIKELIEHTKYKPSIGRFKIFIIDEVHMLTTQAFNALLKTLEEPPDFVKFILATTDPLKLPATILSRTQHFRFKKLSQKVVVKHLEYILNKEGIEYEIDALNIVARSGQGSLRDSLTMLDQAIVYANGKIDINTVTNMLGIVDPQQLNDLIEHIIKKDKDAIIDFIKKFSSYEAEMIIDELTLYMHQNLINGKCKLNALTVDRFFRILSDGKNLLSIGANSEFTLTLTLLKMVEALNIYDIDSMISKLQDELSTVSINKTSTVQENKNLSNTIQTQEPKLEKTKSETTIEPSLMFKNLVSRIYDRNYELGEAFEKNIHFLSFNNNTLSWESEASGEDKKLLIKHWQIIKMLVQEIFGIDTKIEPKKKNS